MRRRSLLELLFPLDCAKDARVRHLVFLRDAMSQEGGQLPMEEVQQPVVHSAEPRTPLVDTLAQVVRLGPAKLGIALQSMEGRLAVVS